MNQVNNKFKAARRASNMTIDEAAELAKLSKQGYINRERMPETFRLYELEAVFNGMSEIAKPLFVEAVNDIFLS